MNGIDEIDNPNVGLGRVFPVQAASVLLQCTFPGRRHRQDQCIERGVVETFPNESPGR